MFVDCGVLCMFFDVGGSILVVGWWLLFVVVRCVLLVVRSFHVRCALCVVSCSLFVG